jgi:hypothetical protein
MRAFKSSRDAEKNCQLNWPLNCNRLAWKWLPGDVLGWRLSLAIPRNSAAMLQLTWSKTELEVVDADLLQFIQPALAMNFTFEVDEDIAEHKPSREVLEQVPGEKHLMSFPIRRLQHSLTLLRGNVTLTLLPSKSLFFVWSNAHSCR